MDEVVMAGGKWGTANNAYYLYNGNYYWTMSPCHFYSSSTYPAYVFLVYSGGSFDNTLVVDTNLGVRPVINLKADTTFSSGNGTLDNPYIVIG